MKVSGYNLFLARLRRRTRQFTWGGEWAYSLAAEVKYNLTWFFFDGLFATASDNIVLTYLTLYFLALGATRQQIGLLSSFTSFVVAAILLPGAMLVERIGHRKEVTVLFGGGIARLAILVLAVLPLLVGGPALVWVAIGLSVLRDAFANLAFPAWMSMTGDMVPLEGRGRYFGSRNFVYGIAAMVIILSSGELITRLGSPFGYQVALGVAFVLGASSTLCFGRLRDPHPGRPIRPVRSMSLRNAWKDMRTHPAFVVLCLVMALWNFSVNIAGPFFNVRMVEDLKFTAAMVGVASIATTISSLLIQRKMGEIADRLGPRRVQVLCMLLIPILPASWIFITQLWQVILLNVLGGVLWGAFNLVSFNFLLTLTPDAQRARYAAVFQTFVTVSLAAGAAFGAWVIGRWGYTGIFTGSALGRVLAGALFALFVPAVERTAIGRTAGAVPE